jgi:hypothetical protein
MALIPMSKKTDAEVFLEWLNEWLTIDRMAENYNLNPQDLKYRIEQGKIEHENNCNPTN